VRSGSAKQLLACLLWSSPAWKMSARDIWIGWTNEARARNLQRVVKQLAVSDSALGAGALSRVHYSLFVYAATARRLGNALTAIARCS
jgi:hypothetical protein